VDLFDLIPFVPPGSASRSRAEMSSAQQLAVGVAMAILPTINFIVVLSAHFAHDGTTALVLLPVISALMVLILGLLLAVSTAWAIVYAMGCAAACFTVNGVALLLVGLGSFFSTF
jgi:hypothetical protein